MPVVAEEAVEDDAASIRSSPNPPLKDIVAKRRPTSRFGVEPPREQVGAVGAEEFVESFFAVETIVVRQAAEVRRRPGRHIAYHLDAADDRSLAVATLEEPCRGRHCQRCSDPERSPALP